MTRIIDRLLFIYNADSGTLNAIVDSAKKLLAINGCALCSLTHSLTGERSEWRSCKETIGTPIDSLHRDELSPSLRSLVGDNLPCVVARAGGEDIVLLTPEVIRRCRGSVADLRGRIDMHAAMRGLGLPS